jgi:hypothetical protein
MFQMGLINLIGCCLGFFCMLSCGFYCGGCIRCPCAQGNKNSSNDAENQNDFEKVEFFILVSLCNYF